MSQLACEEALLNSTHTANTNFFPIVLTAPLNVFYGDREKKAVNVVKRDLLPLLIFFLACLCGADGKAASVCTDSLSAAPFLVLSWLNN